MSVESPYAAQPCRTCGTSVVLLSVLQHDGTHRTVAMDPAIPVYHRVVDPETEPRSAFWIEDVAPKGERRQALARHRCAGRS